MKFNMIVLITSCEPKRAFKTPGIAPQTPPPTIAAMKHKRQMHGSPSASHDSPPNVMPTQAVANAAT